jgi:hypothetical protein
MLEPHIACKSVVVVVHQVVLTLYLAQLLQQVVVVVEITRQVLKVVRVVVVVALLAVAHEQHHQFKVLQVALRLMLSVQVAVVVQVLETTLTKTVV